MMTSPFENPESVALHFGYWKFLGFIICFLFGSTLQVILPYRKLNLVQNWRINLPLAAFNTMVTSALCTSCLSAFSFFLERKGIGLFHFLTASIWIQMITAVLALDATAYFWHRMNHKNSFLWRFHRVHHSDNAFEASTALRFHIGELLISLVIRFTIIAIFGFSIFSILCFELIFQFMNIFEHGNIRLPKKFESAFSKVFVTPALHRKHHSVVVDDLNSNFGTIFSFWDQLGSSLRSASSQESIQVGISSLQRNLTVVELLKLPFSQTNDT